MNMKEEITSHKHLVDKQEEIYQYDEENESDLSHDYEEMEIKEKGKERQEEEEEEEEEEVSMSLLSITDEKPGDILVFIDYRYIAVLAGPLFSKA